MQVSVESTGNLERRVTLSLPAGDVDNQVGGRLREIARTVRIKGFRPGKVPTKVVEQRYGGQVRAEILDGLLRGHGSSRAREQLRRRRPQISQDAGPARVN
jgi:trigger factor